MWTDLVMESDAGSAADVPSKRMNSVADGAFSIACVIVLHGSSERPHVATSFPLGPMKASASLMGKRKERMETSGVVAQ